MKKICLLFLLITIYSGSFSQTLLNNNTEKFKEQSRKINRVEKLKFSSNFYHQKNKNKTIATSNWYDYAYMTINNNSEMYNDILFPDTNVIIPYTDYNGRPWVHSIGTLLDPTSLAFDTLGQEQINYGVPYNLDSICVHFLYNKTNKNIKDTLIIDIWKIPDFSVLSENDIFTMSRDSKSITCMNVNWDSTNYDNSKVKLPGIKDITKVTYKMVLENSDTTTGGNIGGKNLKTNMSVPAGGLIGCAVSFKPGYSYSDDDYITDHNYFQFISMKEQKNKYNDYTEGDYNCSYILPSEIRFNVFSNSIYLPSYYFSSDGNAYSTYFGKTSYPYENHLIDFLISANVPKLKLLKPTGGESIESGKNYVIQWSSEGVSNIKIEFTKDYGTTWKTIVASTSASNGSYTWTPSITDTTKTGDIKISDVSNQYLLDYTKNEILITSPSINIKSPSANDIYATNSNIIIYWESTNVNNVKIEYQTSSKSPWILITSSVSAKSQIYSWTAPSQASHTYRIRVSDVSNESIYSISGTFSVSAPSLQLLSPIGGEKLLVGSSVAISWLSTLIDSIKIEYQTSSTGEWKTIVASTPANKCSFIWKVAKENNSNDCKIKISDINHSEIYSISQVSFEINNAYIKIIKPDGGEFLVRKYQTYISWISQDVSSVKIEYQLEPGDNSWVTIIGNVPSTANSGKYLWTVPDVVSNRCRVKISDINSTAFAVSDSAFTIGSTGINEILTDDTYYKIFPIPATNNIQIEYYSKDRKQVVLELLDYTGRNLYKQNIILERNAINSIDVKDISNGIYFLRIDDEKDVHTKKIIISR